MHKEDACVYLKKKNQEISHWSDYFTLELRQFNIIIIKKS